MSAGTSAREVFGERPTTLIIIPILVVFLVGIGYDFIASDFVFGAYQGCFSTCLAPGPNFFATIFSGTLFGPLFKTCASGVVPNITVAPCPDLEAFFTDFGFVFLGQLFTASFLTSLFAAIAGLIALMIAVGARITLPLGGGLSFDPNTVKLAQSLGVGLIIFSFITGAFGIWLNTLGLGLGTFLGIILTAIEAYGLYWRGSVDF